jgi:galactitol-specific phosphotransferase system IIC component
MRKKLSVIALIICIPLSIIIGAVLQGAKIFPYDELRNVFRFISGKPPVFAISGQSVFMKVIHHSQ